VAAAKWVRMGSSCAHEGSKRPILEMPYDFPKGTRTRVAEASLHINESPYQRAAPVLLNCRASPRVDVPRSLVTEAATVPPRVRHARCIWLSSA